MGTTRTTTRRKAILAAVLPSAMAVAAAASGGVASAQSARQRGSEIWEAASRTAISITGDIKLTANEITILKRTYPMTRVRDVENSHREDVGKILSQSGPPAAATLYRTLVPQRARLIHKNTLCGPNEDARWMLVVRNAEDLALAVFSGESEPDLNYQAMSQSRALCGTFYYVRPGK